MRKERLLSPMETGLGLFCLLKTLPLFVCVCVNSQFGKWSGDPKVSQK